MKPVSSSLPAIKREQGSRESATYGKTYGRVGNHSPIGVILVEAGRLSPENAERILRLQVGEGTRFGDTALGLGLLTEEDIRFALSRQFDYSYLPASDSSLNHELVAAYAPFSNVVEQLRALRSQLILRWFNAEMRHNGLAVVSPGIGEGRSFIAANLGVLFSQLGQRTLLIDADLRNPRQHKLFKLGNTPGLSDLLANRTNAEVIVGVPLLRGLSVLPAGAVPPNPHELLGRPSFAELLNSLMESYDVVIIDTPAAGEYAEAYAAAVGATAALLIARKNYSSASQMIRLARTLQQTPTMVVGSVLNDY